MAETSSGLRKAGGMARGRPEIRPATADPPEPGHSMRDSNLLDVGLILVVIQVVEVVVLVVFVIVDVEVLDLLV